MIASLPHLVRRSARLLAAPALAAALVTACNDLPTRPSVVPLDTGIGHLAVYATLPGASPTLVLQVTGPGIVKPTGAPDTLTFNIPIVAGVATGSVSVPVGSARVFTARAFDGVTETHRGSATADVVSGSNPALSITLIPFIGSIPITVSIGTTLVIVTPATRTMDIGDTLRLTSQVIDERGFTLSGGVVRWATLNPIKAQVDTLGLVTMRDTGDVQVVATYGTVGGSAKLTGTNHRSSTSYYLTWNGSASQSWSDTLNWTPHGVGTARVPTGSDSVVIAASAPRMPRLFACSYVTARDLVVEAGARLDFGCSPAYGISVSRSAVVRGTITAQLRALRAATVAGTLGELIVSGDSVRLSDTTTASLVNLDAAGSELALAGKPLTVGGPVDASRGSRLTIGGTRLTIGGSLTLNDSSWVEMTSAADTLNVRGDLYFGTKDVRTPKLLSAGVLRVGGRLQAYQRFSFAPSGTHQTILDGTATQNVSVDSAALNLGVWQNLTIRNPVHVYMSGVAGNDSIALPNFQLDTTVGALDFGSSNRRWGITPAGGTMTVTDTLVTNYYSGVVRIAGAVTMRSRPFIVGSPARPVAALTGGYYYYSSGFDISGGLTTDTASVVTVANLTLEDASGTANVQGHFSPATLHLTALAPTLKAGLPYVGLELNGTRTGVLLAGPTALSGALNLINGSRLVLNGKSLQVGQAAVLNDSSWVEMTNAADTLNVRGDLTFGTKDVRTGSLLSAGVLRLGGALHATNRFSFAPTGTHQSILDGATSQYIYVDSVALNLGTWQNLTIRNTARLSLGSSAGNDSIALPNFQLDTTVGAIDFGSSNRRWGITPAGGTMTVTDTLVTNYYSGVVRIAGAVTMRSRPFIVGSPARPVAALTGGYYYYSSGFDISGVFTSDTASMVNVAHLTLGNASGTANVQGHFSPGTLHLTALAPTLKAGLPYAGVEFNGTRTGVLLAGPTALSGALNLINGSRLVLNGKSLQVGQAMALNDSSWVEMTSATDTLNVRGDMTFGTKDVRTGGLLSAGVLRVGGNLRANSRFSLAASAPHQTILDGTTGQTVYVDSASLNLGTWPNLTIRNTARVNMSSVAGNDSIALPNFQLDTTVGPLDFGSSNRRWGITPAGGTMTVTDTLITNYYSGIVRIAGAVLLRSRPFVVGSPAPPVAALSGGYSYYSSGFSIAGVLTTDTASAVNVAHLTLQDASGTANVQGHFSPATLHLTALAPTLKAGLPYQSIELNGTRSGVLLAGRTTISGSASLLNGSRLVLNGQALTVTQDMTLGDSSWVEMTKAGDTLNVRNDMTFGSKDVRTGSLLSAGVLRVGHTLAASSHFSFAMTGSHQTILDGTTAQYAEVDSAALNLGTWQNLTIRNPVHVYMYYKTVGTDSIALTNFQLDTLAGGLEFNAYTRRWAINPAGGTLTLTDTLYSSYYNTLWINGAVTLRSRPTVVGMPLPAVADLRSGSNTTIISGALTADSKSVVDNGNLTLQDASGTANVAGYFAPNLLTFTGAQTLRAGLNYQYLTLLGATSVVGTGKVTVAHSFEIGDATHTSASITVPDSSTFGGQVDVYGTLNFAGSANGSAQILQIFGTGTASAQGNTAGVFVDFRTINNQFVGGRLDNYVATGGGRGFRRSVAGAYYTASRTDTTTLGPVPGTF